MKKILLITLVATLISCKKENSEQNNIYGKWKLIHREDVGGTAGFNDMADYEFDDTYTITENSFTFDFGNDEEQFYKGIQKYNSTYSNNRITLSNSEYYQYFEVKAISATELRLRPYYISPEDNPNHEVSNLSVDYEILERVN